MSNSSINFSNSTINQIKILPITLTSFDIARYSCMSFSLVSSLITISVLVHPKLHDRT